MVLKHLMTSGLGRWLEPHLVNTRIFSIVLIIVDLDEKLNHLDAMYTDRRDDLTSTHNLSTEEKLLLFQKNIELRTREGLQQQVS